MLRFRGFQFAAINILLTLWSHDILQARAGHTVIIIFRCPCFVIHIMSAIDLHEA